MLRGAAAGLVGASAFGSLAACAGAGSGGGVGSPMLPSARTSRGLQPHIPSPWGEESVKVQIVNKTGYPNSKISWLMYAKDYDGKFVHLDRKAAWQVCNSSDLKSSGPFKGFADYNNALASSGATEFTLPWANSGVIFFCIEDQIKIGLNGTGNDVSVRAPAAQNPVDPNFEYLWDNIEFSFNPPGEGNKNANITANTQLISKIALPISIKLVTQDGKTQEGGLVKPGGQAAMYDAFLKDPVFKECVVRDKKGRNLRVIGPSVAVDAPDVDVHSDGLKTYFDAYIKQCAHKYNSASNAFTAKYEVNQQAVLFSCYFDSQNNVHVNAPANAPAGVTSFTFGPLTSTNIWFCAGAGIPTAGYQVGIANIVFAAFNRGILLDHAVQPFCDHTKFYQNDVGQNLWCKTIHDNFIDSKVYAFPYDDQCGEFSSTISFAIPPWPNATPVTWTITLEPVEGAPG
jgi:Beta-1,3-glucanase